MGTVYGTMTGGKAIKMATEAAKRPSEASRRASEAAARASEAYMLWTGFMFIISIISYRISARFCIILAAVWEL